MIELRNATCAWVAGSTLVVCAMAGPAFGDLVVSDSFLNAAPSPDNDAAGIYNTGNIVGQSPDTLGFNPTATWTNPGTNSFFAVNDGGALDYAGYGGTGGGLNATNTQGGFRQTGRVMSGDVGDSDTLWASVLIRKQTIDEYLTSAFVGRTASTGGGPLEFGIIGDDFGVNIRTSAGNDSSRTAGSLYTAGDTVLMVMQVQLNDGEGDDDNWYLYVNPDLDSTPDTSEAVLSGVGQLWDSDASLGVAAFRFVTTGGPVNTTASNVTWDEFRIATEFGTLIPEPGSMALLSLGALSLIARTRRD